ncbi:MAG: hypothetical protein IJY57_01110 [Clostridia bacterium]|nr:hypothetical protein [Clostridia bacterium]
MKKLLTLLLTLCLVVLSAFSLVACGEHEHTAKTEWSKDATHHWHACEVDGCTTQLDKAEHSYTQGVCACGAQDANYQPNNGTPTKAELATAYKSVATGCWNQFGAGTVVTTSLNALPSDLPETDLEEKDTPAGIKIAKADAATMFSLIYMIGEYYENDNFVISDGVVTVPLTAVNMGPTPVAGTMSMKPTLDKANNNVKLEMVMYLPEVQEMEIKAYYNFDIDFDFTSNTLIGFNLVMVQDYTASGSTNTTFQQEKMTSDGKYFWLKSEISSEYQTIALQIREQFYTQMESAEVLTGNFDTEFNNYLTNGNAAYEGVMNS